MRALFLVLCAAWEVCAALLAFPVCPRRPFPSYAPAPRVGPLCSPGPRCLRLSAHAGARPVRVLSEGRTFPGFRSAAFRVRSPARGALWALAASAQPLRSSSADCQRPCASCVPLLGAGAVRRSLPEASRRLLRALGAGGAIAFPAAPVCRAGRPLKSCRLCAP